MACPRGSFLSPLVKPRTGTWIKVMRENISSVNVRLCMTSGESSLVTFRKTCAMLDLVGGMTGMCLPQTLIPWPWCAAAHGGLFEALKKRKAFFVSPIFFVWVLGQEQDSRQERQWERHDLINVRLSGQITGPNNLGHPLLLLNLAQQQGLNGRNPHLKSLSRTAR